MVNRPARLLATEFGVHPGDHGGRELLGGQSVASTRHAWHDGPLAVGMRLGECHDDIQIQRLTDRPGLLGAVQNAERAHRCGQRLEERPGGKWAVQPHLHHPDPLAAFSESGELLHHGLAARAHHHQHSLRLRVSRVVDDVHLAAGART